MQDPQFPAEQEASKRRDLVVRVAILGALYTLAVVFAVVFSPSLGVAPGRPAGQVDSVAATPGNNR